MLMRLVGPAKSGKEFRVNTWKLDRKHNLYWTEKAQSFTATVHVDWKLPLHGLACSLDDDYSRIVLDADNKLHLLACKAAEDERVMVAVLRGDYEGGDFQPAIPSRGVDVLGQWHTRRVGTPTAALVLRFNDVSAHVAVTNQLQSGEKVVDVISWRFGIFSLPEIDYYRQRSAEELFVGKVDKYWTLMQKLEKLRDEDARLEEIFRRLRQYDRRLRKAGADGISISEDYFTYADHTTYFKDLLPGDLDALACEVDHVIKLHEVCSKWAPLYTEKLQGSPLQAEAEFSCAHGWPHLVVYNYHCAANGLERLSHTYEFTPEDYERLSSELRVLELEDKAARMQASYERGKALLARARAAEGRLEVTRDELDSLILELRTLQAGLYPTSSPSHA